MSVDQQAAREAATVEAEDDVRLMIRDQTGMAGPVLYQLAAQVTLTAFDAGVVWERGRGEETSRANIAEQKLRASEAALTRECANSGRLCDRLVAAAVAWAEWKPDLLDEILDPHMPEDRKPLVAFGERGRGVPDEAEAVDRAFAAMSPLVGLVGTEGWMRRLAEAAVKALAGRGVRDDAGLREAAAKCSRGLIACPHDDKCVGRVCRRVVALAAATPVTGHE